jgi:hypothetical protein
MSAATQMVSQVAAPAIPIHDALPWVVFVGLLCLLGVYFVGDEQGATSVLKGM